MKKVVECDVILVRSEIPSKTIYLFLWRLALFISHVLSRQSE